MIPDIIKYNTTEYNKWQVIKILPETCRLHFSEVCRFAWTINIRLRMKMLPDTAKENVDIIPPIEDT